jgi:hypothetical protein
MVNYQFTIFRERWKERGRPGPGAKIYSGWMAQDLKARCFWSSPSRVGPEPG